VNKAHDLALKLDPFLAHVLSKTEEPLIYSVDGLPAAHVCLIGSAGTSLCGIRRWYVHWHRDTVMILAIARLYDSPEQPLEAAAEFWETQKTRVARSRKP
jgi:hypothetical protein